MQTIEINQVNDMGKKNNNVKAAVAASAPVVPEVPPVPPVNGNPAKPAFVLPPALPIYGRDNVKILGHRQVFTNSGSARDIKLRLQAVNPSLKGKKLAHAVNDVLKGEVEVRQQLGVAYLQAAHQGGFVISEGSMKDRTGNIKLIKVDAPVKPTQAQVVEAVKEMTPDQRAALLKALGVELPAAPEKPATELLKAA